LSQQKVRPRKNLWQPAILPATAGATLLMATVSGAVLASLTTAVAAQ